MGNSESHLPPAVARAPHGQVPPSPYATGPYAPAVQPQQQQYPPFPGAPMPMQYGAFPPQPMMTPEMMQAAIFRGVPPQSFFHPAFQGPGGGWPQPVAPPRMEHAVTIRNDVNVKKASLRMIRSHTAPQRLFLEFQFDANLPCAVTVYYVHRSDELLPPATSLVQRLTPFRAPQCGVRTLFKKGLSQHFSQALQAGAAAGGRGGPDWLDCSAFNEEEITNAPAGEDGHGGSAAALMPSSVASASAASALPAARFAALPPFLYPIVIVLETVPESDPLYATACAAPPCGTPAPTYSGMAGHAAAAAAPGTAASHVSLQVTYATLFHKAADEHLDAAEAAAAGSPSLFSPSHAWVVKPMRQRIQVAGTVYELKEIFGMDGGDRATGEAAAAGAAGSAADAGSAAAHDAMTSGSECVICLTDKRDTTVLPCRHMCLCYDCAQQLRHSTNKCPVCRTPVTSLLQIKMAGATGADAPGALNQQRSRDDDIGGEPPTALGKYAS